MSGGVGQPLRQTLMDVVGDLDQRSAGDTTVELHQILVADAVRPIEAVMHRIVSDAQPMVENEGLSDEDPGVAEGRALRVAHSARLSRERRF